LKILQLFQQPSGGLGGLACSFRHHLDAQGGVELINLDDSMGSRGNSGRFFGNGVRSSDSSGRAGKSRFDFLLIVVETTSIDDFRLTLLTEIVYGVSERTTFGGFVIATDVMRIGRLTLGPLDRILGIYVGGTSMLDCGLRCGSWDREQNERRRED
jgi:hypothetical protein